ncbi:hypothetical protein AHAS_Ahas07G0085900 [Arachis hypogaea]
MEMDILLWRIVVESRIHLVGESSHTLEVVHLGHSMEKVVLGSVDIVVVPYMVHMAQKVVGMVDMDQDHMEVFGGKRLVSMVDGYVEDMAHKHMVVVLDSHKEDHHSHLIGMHHRMALIHSALVEVVAKKIDHMHMALPTLNCSNLDACLHCSSYFLQHS